MNRKRIKQKVAELKHVCIDEDCSLVVMAGKPSVDDKKLYGAVYGSVSENEYMLIKMLEILAKQAGRSTTCTAMVLAGVAAQCESNADKNAPELLSKEFKRVYEILCEENLS